MVNLKIFPLATLLPCFVKLKSHEEARCSGWHTLLSPDFKSSNSGIPHVNEAVSRGIWVTANWVIPNWNPRLWYQSSPLRPGWTPVSQNMGAQYDGCYFIALSVGVVLLSNRQTGQLAMYMSVLQNHAIFKQESTSRGHLVFLPHCLDKETDPHRVTWLA